MIGENRNMYSPPDIQDRDRADERNQKVVLESEPFKYMRNESVHDINHRDELTSSSEAKYYSWSVDLEWPSDLSLSSAYQVLSVIDIPTAGPLWPTMDGQDDLKRLARHYPDCLDRDVSLQQEKDQLW